MRLLLTGCRLPQNREFVSAICSQNPVYPDQRVFTHRGAASSLPAGYAGACVKGSKTPQFACVANAAGIGVLRLIDFILPGVQDTSERAR